MHELRKKALLIGLFFLAAGALTACDWFRSTTTTSSIVSSSETTSTSVTTTSLSTDSSTASTTSTTVTTTTTTTTTTEPTTTTTSTTTTTTTTTETTTTTTTTVEVRSLELVPPEKLSYYTGETLDLSGLIVTFYLNGQATVLSPEQYKVGSVDLSSIGTKTVMIYACDLTASFEISVQSGFLITMEYYMSAQDLEGQALLLELREIINTGFAGKSYGDARYLLDDTDADPAKPGNVLLIYNGASVSGTWDGGAAWNREHVWPQSLLGVPADNSTINEASDLQNLKPCNPSINSSRGNKYFDVATTTVSYLPRAQDRGDIARILFYMVVKYSRYSLVETTPAVNQMAKFSVLLLWHEQDPVDDFERYRNNKIYEFQNNRNPFIDYPEFVDLIWG